ncbi:MAG: PRC-barrel domain-containing protein, partial [Solirubrobacteraceae bacterium]
MPETTEAYDFRGRTLIDAEGEKLGKIDELYYDEQGGQPEWALVNTGLFGTKKTFVPIASASPAGDDLKV